MGDPQGVFISYAWGGEKEEIVNQIDQALQKRGIKIIRDKRDLGYKGSIRAFMESLGKGVCVIVVISDKYLRSSNCMFELIEIAENKQFHDPVRSPRRRHSSLSRNPGGCNNRPVARVPEDLGGLCFPRLASALLSLFRWVRNYCRQSGP
jgi:hypothetical protein